MEKNSKMSTILVGFLGSVVSIFSKEAIHNTIEYDNLIIDIIFVSGVLFLCLIIYFLLSIIIKNAINMVKGKKD